jgi:hypothetical protein
MGVDEDFALGFNAAPYSIVNQEGQGWRMPEVLVSEEAAACTRCHRIGNGRWMRSWIDRLVSADSSWTNITTESHRSFERAFWMPPDLQGLDAESWPTSDYARAVEFIRNCGRDASACRFEPLPREQIIDPGEPPPVTLEGRELATEALKILGGSVIDPADPRCTGEGGSCATRRCAECHSVSRSGLRGWLDFSETAWSVCKIDGDPEQMTEAQALDAVNCLRVDPTDPTSVFAAEKIGIQVTGVQYGHFRRLFRRAFGETRWLSEYLRFRARVSMPKGNHPAMTQIEYATVLKWFQERLPSLDDVIEDPPPPATCENYLSPELAAHISDMQFEGWGAVNAENGIRMYGCRTSNALECLADRPDRTADWGGGMGTIRELGPIGFRTSFWTRSSADGRFVGNGGGNGVGATITDLSRGVDIGIEASYDPGFFPDNSGFIFQGGGAGICAQSVLESDDLVDFSEAGCIRANGINLYQHVARGLGGDYFIINSQFTSDSGNANRDPAAYFGAESTMKFTPMLFDGSVYDPLEPIVVDSPYEGDSVLSPSSRVVISRLAGPEGRSLGFVLREVTATRTGTTYRIGIDRLLGRVCFEGAKPNVSFDERFFVTHHYGDGVSNIVLVDLTTGAQQQITNMQAGAEARYPHFRSDGWIYFLVVAADGSEFMAASDAAIRIAAP